MLIGENQLTEEKFQLLKQGTKVEFKWWGRDILYTGRIEIDKYGRIFYVNEHHYNGDDLKSQSEGMRYYTLLEEFYNFTYFEIK